MRSGFVQIHPSTDYSINSPDGSGLAQATSWSIVGPWNLVRCESSSGGNPFYTELPWSMGVQSPISIDERTGEIFSSPTQTWRSNLFRELWNNKSNTPVEVTRVKRRPVKKAVLINCLYPWWGDSISLLWRVNQLDYAELSNAGFGIIAIISPDLQWLLPPEIDEAWVVPPAHISANQWNEMLDLSLHNLVASLHSCYIPCLFQPTRATPKEIEAYTGIRPFSRNDWIDRLTEKPTVTFMYRPDRCWGSNQILVNFIQQSFNVFPSSIRRLLYRVFNNFQLHQQKKNIVSLANSLRYVFGDIEFAIAGTSTDISFPDWFVDIRSNNPGEESNRASAEQCSRSHLMIGVAGSCYKIGRAHV